jgi:hypothetical protein
MPPRRCDTICVIRRTDDVNTTLVFMHTGHNYDRSGQTRNWHQPNLTHKRSHGGAMLSLRRKWLRSGQAREATGVWAICEAPITLGDPDHSSHQHTPAIFRSWYTNPFQWWSLPPLFSPMWLRYYMQGDGSSFHLVWKWWCNRVIIYCTYWLLRCDSRTKWNHDPSPDGSMTMPFGFPPSDYARDLWLATLMARPFLHDISCTIISRKKFVLAFLRGIISACCERHHLQKARLRRVYLRRSFVVTCVAAFWAMVGGVAIQSCPFNCSIPIVVATQRKSPSLVLFLSWSFLDGLCLTHQPCTLNMYDGL